MSNQNLPLYGVKVLDLTIYVAGPAAGTQLGYLGADVIKVEPMKGDPYRVSGRGYGMPAEAKQNPLFDACNGFKRCVTVDFRSSEGKEVLRRLAAKADIILTNYREKPLYGMGMDYETVSAYNPKVVYGYFSGYGDIGPDAERPGFDATTFFSRSGFAMRGTYAGRAPMASISAAGDTISSMALTTAVLAAYVKAAKTGKGEKITSSLYSSALWVMGVGIAQAQFGYIGPFPEEAPGFIALSSDYECSDHSWIRICGMTAERYWAPLCRALKMEEYIDDPRYCTSLEQHRNIGECKRLVQSYFINYSYEEISARLLAEDVPFERNCKTDEIIHDEQALVNGFVKKTTYENGREVYMAYPPFKLASGEEPDITRRGPYPGEHTVEVMKEYGFGEEEIETMLENGKAFQCK